MPLTRRNLLRAGAFFFERGRRPNILFFFPDQHRYDWVGGGAIPVRTPNLDRLAARGMRFTNAIVGSPLCAPSRACLASGREYSRCGVRNNGQDFPLELPTFYRALRESGYFVAGCGKFDLHKATQDWGLDGKRLLKEWGFSDGIDNAGKIDAVTSGASEPRDPYMAFLHARGLAAMHVEDFRRRTGPASYLCTDPTPLPEDAYCDNWVAENGLKLLRAAPQGTPWFLQVNFTGPHNPVDITRRMERRVRGREFPLPVESAQYTAERHRAIRQNYSAMVENIDRWLGIYMEELRKRGEWDNTLIVYSSDHGEMLGDHERWGKSVPYHPSVAVPLYICGPGVERGKVTPALVSHIDLAATFLDFARAPRLPGMQARSLRPLLEGKARTHREFVRSGLNDWRMVFDGRYKLIRGFQPRPAAPLASSAARKGPSYVLFDLKLDPQETKNLEREAPNQVERLSKRLDA